MDPSEIVDSGSVSVGRSNFSKTCGLLSQYLKENGGLGGLSLGPTPNPVESKGTMDLLKIVEKSGEKSGALSLAAGGDGTVNRSESETAPMTIFYAGKVIVYNNFPADKAKEIMMLASKCSSADFAPAAESATSSPNRFPVFILPERALLSPQPVLGSDLPMARKNSLARFLEKRKHRIAANAPYQVKKAGKAEPWLGLSPLLHQEMMPY